LFFIDVLFLEVATNTFIVYGGSVPTLMLSVGFSFDGYPAAAFLFIPVYPVGLAWHQTHPPIMLRRVIVSSFGISFSCLFPLLVTPSTKSDFSLRASPPFVLLFFVKWFLVVLPSDNVAFKLRSVFFECSFFEVPVG